MGIILVKIHVQLELTRLLILKSVSHIYLPAKFKLKPIFVNPVKVEFN